MVLKRFSLGRKKRKDTSNEQLNIKTVQFYKWLSVQNSIYYIKID